MTDSEWTQIKHFSKNEEWGDASRMEWWIVSALDKFREFLGLEIVVSKGTQGVHVEHSNHYLGRAIDIVIPKVNRLKGFDIFIAASRFDFTGIGLYADWAYEGVPCVGLHVETCPLEPHRKYWLGIRTSDGQGYINLSVENLRIHGLLN